MLLFRQALVKGGVYRFKSCQCFELLDNGTLANEFQIYSDFVEVVMHGVSSCNSQQILHVSWSAG